MIDKLIGFSIQNKLVVGLFVLGLVVWGIHSFNNIPIDAVPDITTNQVQIVTQCPTLATQEVEQFVTFPIEAAMANLPEVEEIRSISRFGISVITVVFEEHVDIYHGRQLISEQLKIAEADIPDGFGNPELGPITSGLGEVYQYVLHAAPGYEDKFSDMDLRTINDWIVKRQLAGTPGVIEVSGWGGHKKQYEVAINPAHLNSLSISIPEVFKALESNNENTGGSYIEKQFNTYFIRGEGLVRSIEDIENIVVKTSNGVPVLIRDVATVGFGSAPRYGAITYNGQGEVVGGQALMLKGENSYKVVEAVKARIEVVKKSLPEGVVLEPFLDRSILIGRAMSTVSTNLIEGGLIVILILVLLLGNLRGGLIVASVIPLSMLFAMGMMRIFGVSANLMSLGAIDFGLVVDGSIIVVEAILYRLSLAPVGQRLSGQQMNDEVYSAASQIRGSAAFGEIIILIVYLPILALVGIEGKMFGPMAKTVSFAILGALILSMTYVPMMSALFLKKELIKTRTISDRIMERLQRWYTPILAFALRRKAAIMLSTLVLLCMSVFTFTRLGGEFMPQLDEGDFALHQILPSGSSLSQSVEVSEKIQKTLMANFPEVIAVVSKIGTAEIPTDPMPIEVGDIMVHMKPKGEWLSASSKEGMFARMEEVLADIPGVEYEFTQPIQMRFNELIAGVREDIAIKIFGENTELLYERAKAAEKIIKNIDGVGDLRVEQTQGLPQLMVSYQRQKIAQYGLNIRDLNTVLRTAFAGETAGVVFEEERRFDLVLRLEEQYRQDIEDIRNLYVPLPNGSQLPLKEVANIEMKDGPMQISRDDAKRRIVLGVNARNRDTETLVEEIKEKLDAQLDLPPGYYIEYGGQFKNLIAAKERLSVAVPVALLLILVLLFFTFRSLKQAFLIFTAIPLSAIGGIYALWLRDMPFSISAGVGFIALFGVAVLNGIVLIAYFNQLKREGMMDIDERIQQGTKVRLRPVIMTASVAALGFLPMALSTSAGAEVQRPLATVVIGGLITATFLTLILLPLLYRIFDGMDLRWNARKTTTTLSMLLLVCGAGFSQTSTTLGLEEAVRVAKEGHPALKAAELSVEQQRKLKKTAFSLANTDISYSTGQLNSSEIDYQWQVTQEVELPFAYIARSKLAQTKLTLKEQELGLTSLGLERNVRKAWLELAYYKERTKELDIMADRYRVFANAASKRHAAGETGLLEKANANAQYQRMLIRLEEARADERIGEIALAQNIGRDSAVTVPEGSFKKMSTSASGQTGAQDPFVDIYLQNTLVAEQASKEARSAFFPTLNFGYFNQQIDGVQQLDGVQFGVGIPLFFWSAQGKVQAAKIGSEIALQRYDEKRLLYAAQRKEKSAEHAKTVNVLVWYEGDGLAMAQEVQRAADAAYRIGDIGYVEYLASLEQASTIRLEYLDALHKHNQTLTDLHYLQGAFNP